MTLNLTSIKYKPKVSMHSGEINWHAITEKDEQRKLYNKYLLKLTTKDMTYDNFCKAVVQAGRETATAIENKLKDGTQQAKTYLHLPSRKRTDCAIDCMTSIFLHLQ
jgi:hypothetical protein